MVFLALTPGGLVEALALASGSPVWCCASAITEAEFAARRSPNLTRFAYFVSSSSSCIAEAVVTINEHHPNERVWVESTGAA
jgi:hypothetical protein